MKSNFVYPRINRSPLVGHVLFCFREKILVRVTALRFELTSQRQKVSRLPTEPPGRMSPISLWDGVITFRQGKDQPGKVANPARSPEQGK